jgi:hypothetical protein
MLSISGAPLLAIQNLFGSKAPAKTPASPATFLPDDSTSTRISPQASMLSRLQQLQTSDPAQFQQVTAQMAARLQKASALFQQAGDSTTADRIGKLADQFQKASETGTMPSVQDLQQSAGAAGQHYHGGHHHHGGASSGTGATDAQTSLLSAYTSNQNTQSTDLLAMLQPGAPSTDPLSVFG